jgi:hypothetical protein
MFLLIIQEVLIIIFFLLKTKELLLLLLFVKRIISKYINFRKIIYSINRINGYYNISIEILLTNIIKYLQKIIQIYVWKILGLRIGLLIGLG